MRKVLLSEDVTEDVIKDYIDRGFKPHFLSKRKIRKKDKKIWNKIKKFNLNPELDLKFGKVNPNDYTEINITGDIILDKLIMMGSESKGRVIRSSEINSMSDAIKFEKSVSDIDLKFVTVKVFYRYDLRDDVPPAKSGSRPFCTGLMSNRNKLWTLEEIKSLDNGMKDVDDVFLYRGGFYNNPDTGVTTPFCRHRWIAEVRIS
jgi:hypothetical protein